MATNLLAPNPVTDIDGPEVHRHEVPIVKNIEEPERNLGDGVPVGEPDDDHGEPSLVPDKA